MLCPPALSVKTVSQETVIALICVTIPHHLKTTFVLGTGSSASLEFLAGERLLGRRGGVLLLSQEATVTTCPPFQQGFILLFSNCLIQSLMETCPSFSSHKPCRAPRQSVLRVTTGISDCQLKLNGHLITQDMSWKQNFI